MTVPPSSTPAFDATKLFNNYTFAQNVTSSTLNGLSDSQLWGVNLCQNSTGNFNHTWPSAFAQKPAISSVANTCLNALFWNNGGTLRLAAEPHTGSPTVRYVSPRGNDSNDGYTLATAKLTVGAAYDSIPNTIGAGGATIYVDGSLLTNGWGVAMDATPGQGLWICGGGDAACQGTPPPGFRTQKQGTFKLIGIGHSSSPSNTVGGMAVVYGCSPTDATKPVLWWTGPSHGLYVENIDFGNGQCAQPVKIGIGTDGNRANSGGNTIQFENVAATAKRNSPANGPGIDIGSNVIWLWFNRIACDGNITAPVGSDARACIVENPGPGTASGPVYLTNSTFNGAGGTKFYQGPGGLSVFAENLMMESDGNTLCPPVVWLPNTNFASFAQVRNIQHADCPTTNVYPAFENDGTAPASNMLVEFAYGQNLNNVGGAATVLNTPSKANIKTPEAAGQLGFWDDSGSGGQNGRISGQHDSARRAFGAVGVPYMNVAKTLPGQWVAVSGSVTTGVTAPNGTMNAATLSSSSGLCDVRPWQNGSFTASAGDGFVAGVWARAHGSWVTGQKIIGVGFQSAIVAGGNSSGVAPLRGDGEWEWVSTSGKLATGQTNQVANLSLSCDATHPIDFFGPVLLYFPAGATSDNELAYLREHLQSFPETASVGDVTTLRRTRLSFGVPNADYFGKFTSQPFTQDHIFTWPDQDGSVDTHSSTPVAGNCTTWASGTQTGDYGQPCHAELVNSQSGTSYTVINSDLSKLVTFTSPAAVSITLPQPGYGNFGSGWYADFQCQGAGGCSITPSSSTIDAGSSLGLSQGQGVRIVGDGSNYFTMRGIGGGGAITGSGASGTIPLWTSTNGQGNSPLTYSSPAMTLTAPGNTSLQIKTSSSGANYPNLQFLDNTGATKAQVLATTSGDVYFDMGSTSSNMHFRSSLNGSDLMRMNNNNLVILGGVQVGSSQGFYMNSAGKLVTYGGVNTAGNGMSTFLYSYTTPSPQGAPIGNTTMLTPGASALYQFTGEINCTVSSSSSVTLTLTFTDTSNTAQSLPITANCSVLGPSSVADIVHAIRAKGGTSISWSTSITGTPTYDAEVRLQSM